MLAKLSMLKKGVLLVAAPLLFQLVFLGLANKSQRLQLDADQLADQAREILHAQNES